MSSLVKIQSAQLVKIRSAGTGRLLTRGRPQPFLDGVARQTRALDDFTDRQCVAVVHPSDFAYHCHGDHLLFLLLKYSAGGLDTLVNFQSASGQFHGQFSVGGNSRPPSNGRAIPVAVR